MLLMTGCTRTLYTPAVQRHTVIDTIVSQVVDSAMVRALFECDSLGNVLMTELHQSKGKLADQHFDFADNELRVETRWQTKFIDRVIELRDTVTVVELKEVVTEKPYIPTLFWCCLAFSLVSLLRLCWKFFR